MKKAGGMERGCEGEEDGEEGRVKENAGDKHLLSNPGCPRRKERLITKGA